MPCNSQWTSVPLLLTDTLTNKLSYHARFYVALSHLMPDTTANYAHVRRSNAKGDYLLSTTRYDMMSCHIGGRCLFLSHQNSGVRLILTTREASSRTPSFPTQPVHRHVIGTRMWGIVPSTRMILGSVCKI